MNDIDGKRHLVATVGVMFITCFVVVLFVYMRERERERDKSINHFQGCTLTPTDNAENSVLLLRTFLTNELYKIFYMVVCFRVLNFHDLLVPNFHLFDSNK